jgi:hypothetical protein
VRLAGDAARGRCAPLAFNVEDPPMAFPWRPLIFWTPRILTILFALFLGLFALDVFNEGLGFWKTLLALFMHLIPTWLVLAALAIAWRWEWAGAVLFAGLGALYIVQAWGRFPLATYVLISGPLFLLATLFLVDWLYRTPSRPDGSTVKTASGSANP